jgi:Amt family ammonium transporter
VSAGSAAIIGLVSGLLVVESVFFFDRRKIDDPVGAISVHGMNGAWGCLSIGLFADGTYGDGWNGVSGTVTGLFYGGGLSQFWAELIGVLTCFVTLSVISMIVFKIADAIVGNRVPESVEIEGLDIPEMGLLGYNSFVFDRAAETPHAK